ncbi:MAG TPA: pseudouridine synthase [Steroidobacteraceae bacterium]|nr:pseudouridine synthase [Steroidobacteraceae bacterium]
MPARLHKLLAASGHGSRRAIERWIRAGRITRNGYAAELGEVAEPGDDIRLDGRRLQLALPQPAIQVLLYHKPAGEVTTRQDPQGRPTVFNHLPPPRHGRWVAVGRLDVGTTGLLLFTTDGALAHRLMHPSSEVQREYVVRVRGHLAREKLTALTAGVELEDGRAHFDVLEPLPAHGHAPAARTHRWYRVSLREGRNREVRRLWMAVGCEVSRLKRVRYGPIELPAELAPGAWRYAAPHELAALQAAAPAVGEQVTRNASATIIRHGASDDALARREGGDLRSRHAAAERGGDRHARRAHRVGRR